MAGELMKEKVDCPCGDPKCDKYGTPKKKMQKDGLHHVSGCPCKRCAGGRHRANSRRRENTVAKDLGGKREIMSGAFSGIDVRVDEVVWIEETSNKALCAGFKRWWTGKGTTGKLERLHKVARTSRIPVAFVASWDGKPQAVAMSYESFVNLVEAAKQGHAQ